MKVGGVGGGTSSLVQLLVDGGGGGGRCFFCWCRCCCSGVEVRSRQISYSVVVVLVFSLLTINRVVYFDIHVLTLWNKQIWHRQDVNYKKGEKNLVLPCLRLPWKSKERKIIIIVIIIIIMKYNDKFCCTVTW